MPNLCQTLFQFIEFMNLISTANVSMHAFVPNEDILALNLTQEYIHN